MPPERGSASIPKRSSGAACGEAVEQVGAGDARAAARLVDDDGGARQLAACSARPGSTMPCSITRVGVAPASQKSALKCVTCTSSEVVAVGGRVAHLGDPALGRVVLDVDGREVAARAAAEPLLARGRSSSCGRWRTTTSNGSSRSALGRQLGDAVARPGVGAGDADAVGPAVGQHRHDVVVVGRGRTRSSTRRARARAGSSRRPPPARARRRSTAPTHVLDRDAAEARVARDRAGARAAAGARHVDEEQLVRHPPRAPAHRRARSGRTARRPACRPRRPGAPGRCCRRRRSARAGEHLGQLGERRRGRRGRRPGPRRAGDARGQRALRRAAGDDARGGRRRRARRTSAALRSGAQARAGTEAPGCTTT